MFFLMNVGVRLILRSAIVGLLALAAVPLAASPDRKTTGSSTALKLQISVAPTNSALRSKLGYPAGPCSIEAQASLSGSVNRDFKRRSFVESASAPANEALKATRIGNPPAFCPLPPLQPPAVRKPSSSDANRQRAP